MNIAGVKQAIRAAIQNGSLQLGPNVLQSSEISALFDAYFPALNLEIDNASVTEATDSITVAGQGHNQPITGLSVTATFTAPGDTAQCLIVATTSPSWKITTGFPQLTGSIFSDLSFSAGATLTFNSTGISTATVMSGLQFSGSLDLASFVGDVGWLFGGIPVLAVSGPIQMDHGEPEVNLSAPLSGPISIGYLDLPAVSLRLVSQFLDATSEFPEHFETYAELASTLSFTAKGTNHDIPIAARYQNQGGLIALVADLSDNVVSGLVEIAEQLAEKADLLGAAKDFEPPLDLNLTSLTVRVDLLNRALMGVTIGVETGKAWPMISDTQFGNVLTIDKLGLVFTYLAATKSLDLAAYGEIAIGQNGIIDMYGDADAMMFGGGLRTGTSVNLSEVVEHFMGSTPDAPEFDVVAFDFQVQAKQKSFFVTVGVTSTWSLSIGTIDLRLFEVGFSINHAPGATSAAISGAASVGPVDLALNWEIPGDFQFSSVVPEIQLKDLIKAFSTKDMWGGEFPNPTLENSLFYLERRADGSIYAAVGTSFASSPTHKAFGTAEFDFLESGGTTGCVVGFALDETFKLGDLNTKFSAFDFIQLTGGAIILSSVTDPTFQFRSFSEPTFNFPSPLPNAPTGVVEGLGLYAILALKGGALDNVGKLLKGVGGLQLAVQIPTDVMQTEFEASLDGQFHLIGDYVILDQVALFFYPGKEEFGLSTTMTFSLQQGASLQLTGIIEISGASVDLELSTSKPWHEPFGIKGLTIEGMGVGIGIGDDITLTLAGSISIGSDNTALVLEVAMEFSAEEEGLPKALLAKEKEVGHIDLSALITEFAPEVHVPSELLDISLSNFQLIIVADPVGFVNPLDNKRYGMGLNVGGALDFYGLNADFAIQIDYSSGLSATGDVAEPVKIGDFLTLSNATESTKGPYATINTISSPFLEITAAVQFYEIAAASIDIEVKDTKLAFHLADKVDRLGDIDLSFHLDGSTGFSATSEATFTLGNVGPIKAGDWNLGTLNVDVTMKANFALILTPSDFKLSTGATFTFQGVLMRLPSVSIHENLAKLEDIVDAYAKRMAEELWDVGKKVLQDAKALFDAVRAGAISLTDDIGHILHDLGTSIADAAGYLKSVSNAMAWDAEKVAGFLKSGFAADAKAVATAMKAAEYEVEDVTTALKKTFSLGVNDAMSILHDLSYDWGSIARALRSVFDYDAKQAAQFLKDFFKVSDNAVNDALQAAQYAKNDIESAMESVFDWAKHAWDKAKHKLNPKNW